MFRELTRKNKQLSPEECIALLTEEKRGVLSVLGDDEYPYGMPMNHYYDHDGGCLYFHCGRQRSHRSDALRRHPKASFCVMNEGVVRPGEWALEVKSVIVMGRAEIIDDYDMAVRISACLSRKFTQDEAYIQQEIRRSGRATLLIRLTIENICGKVVTES